MRILIAEDDSLLGDGISAGLKQAGFAVDWVLDGEAARLALSYGEYSLVLLDLGLPKLHGLELLKWLREKKLSTPVLILTARDTIPDKILGLNAGADDYVIKPFDLDELIARIHAILRRSKGAATPLLAHGNIVLDPTAHQVTLSGENVDVSTREFMILHELLLNAGRVLSREQLEQKLYGWGEEVESNSVEVHIHYLRKKLGSNFIRTIRGLGYVVDKA